MQITVKPQDRTEPETLELKLHPEIVARLKAYAQSLNDSDVSYVAAQIFGQVLPPLKGVKKGADTVTAQAKTAAGQSKNSRALDPTKRESEVSA